MKNFENEEQRVAQEHFFGRRGRGRKYNSFDQASALTSRVLHILQSLNLNKDKQVSAEIRPKNRLNLFIILRLDT